MTHHHAADRRWEQAQRYFQSGRFDAAQAMCESILSAEPTHARAGWMLSAIRANQGRFRLAVDLALTAAAGLSGGYTPDWLNLSWSLMSLGESEAAMRLLQRMPDPPAEHSRLLVDAAIQYRSIDCHGDALRCVNRAMANGFRHPVAHHVKGQTLMYLGSLEPAVADFEEAIRLQPDMGMSHWHLSQIGPAEHASRRIDRLRRLVATSEPGSELAATLHYALFRELDRGGDLAAAWAALAQGAAIRRARLRHDPEAAAALLRQIEHAWLARGPDGGDDDGSGVTPLFVVGMPRTGTTVLERILGNHPDVAICGELNDARFQYRWGVDHGGSGALDAAAAAKMVDLDAGEFGRRYLSHTAWRRPGRAWQLDKNQDNFLLCGPILAGLRRAKILHVRRQPMDSCFSNLKELFVPEAYGYSYDFDHLARHFHGYRRLMDFWCGCAPDRILEVDYETMVSEPDGTAARVLAFCGLPSVTGLADITANTAPVSTASSAQVRAPIHTRGIASWRRYERWLAPLAAALERHAPRAG